MLDMQNKPQTQPDNQSINEKTSRSQFSQQPVYGSVKTQQEKKINGHQTREQRGKKAWTDDKSTVEEAES